MPYAGVVGARTLESGVEGKSTRGKFTIELLAVAKLRGECPTNRRRVFLGRDVGEGMRARGIRGRERKPRERVGLPVPARRQCVLVPVPEQFEFKVVGRPQRRLQLRAQLGIRGLKADGVGLVPAPARPPRAPRRGCPTCRNARASSRSPSNSSMTLPKMCNRGRAAARSARRLRAAGPCSRSSTARCRSASA